MLGGIWLAFAHPVISLVIVITFVAVFWYFAPKFFRSIKANMIGRSAHWSANYLVQTLDLPITAEEYMEERDSKLREKFPGCEAMPGAEALIRELNEPNNDEFCSPFA